MPVNNVSPSLSYTELDGTDVKVPAVDNTWEDWDLSAICPSASVVCIVGNNSTNGTDIGVRKNGSAQSRLWKSCDAGSLVMNSSFEAVPDSSGIIEVYGQATEEGFAVIGYWS